MPISVHTSLAAETRVTEGQLLQVTGSIEIFKVTGKNSDTYDVQKGTNVILNPNKQ
jgi:hypothetical protein